MTTRLVPYRQVLTGGRQTDEAQRQGQQITAKVRQMPFHNGVWVRNVTLGLTATTVAHGLGRVPDGFFATVAKASSYDDALAPRMWLDRILHGPQLNTLTNPAGNFTTGTRFAALTARECIGVRFAGYNGGVARTYDCSLWVDSGSVLVSTAQAALPANTTRVAAAFFPSPVVLTAGTTYVVGVHDSGSAVYIKSGVDAMAGVLPIQWGSDITLSAMNIWLAGAGKPTNVTAAETYWVEPILTDRRGIQVERSQTQPTDVQNTINLIAAEAVVADLWFY